MGQIYWDQFSWETFATLTAGLSAVSSALVIGLRQAKIAERQAMILEEQKRINELSLRSQLFEKRFAVYKATAMFLGDIMAHVREPEAALQQEFLRGKDQARFLFAPAVNDKLQDIWARSCRFFAIKSMMDHSFATTGTYGQENVDAEHIYLNWLNETLSDLAGVFGEELRLSAASMSLGQESENNSSTGGRFDLKIIGRLLKRAA